jgi:hypothetical protein
LRRIVLARTSGIARLALRIGTVSATIPVTPQAIRKRGHRYEEIAWKFDRQTARRKFGYGKKSLKLENRERMVRDLDFGRVLRGRE